MKIIIVAEDIIVKTIDGSFTEQYPRLCAYTK